MAGRVLVAGPALVTGTARVAGSSRTGTPWSGHSRRDGSSGRISGCCRPRWLGGPGAAAGAGVTIWPGYSRQTGVPGRGSRWRGGLRSGGPPRIRPVRIRPIVPERDSGAVRGTGPPRLPGALLAGPFTRPRPVVIAWLGVRGAPGPRRPIGACRERRASVPVMRGTTVNPVPVAVGLGVTTFHRAPPKTPDQTRPLTTAFHPPKSLGRTECSIGAECILYLLGRICS